MNDQSNEENAKTAEYVDVELSKEALVGQAWEKIKNQLVEGAESVEVIPKQDGDGFILRSWWGIRSDGSNTV